MLRSSHNVEAGKEGTLGPVMIQSPEASHLDVYCYGNYSWG